MKNKDLAVLVIDKNSRYHGRLGRIRELKHNGKITVQFDGKGREDVTGKQIEVFYRHDNAIGTQCDIYSTGPRSLAQMYREIGGMNTISEFVDEYMRIFGERPEKYG